MQCASLNMPKAMDPRKAVCLGVQFHYTTALLGGLANQWDKHRVANPQFSLV